MPKKNSLKEFNIYSNVWLMGHNIKYVNKFIRS